MDIDPSTIPSGWAAVGATVLILATALWAALSRKWGRADEEARKKREHYNAYLAAWEEWQDLMDAGDAPAASKVREAIEEMKAKNWHIAPIAAVCLMLLYGCRSAPVQTPEPEVETVLLSEHVRIAAPGDIVPDLPDGESRWWLCTGKGMKLLLPSDAPVNRMKEASDACD